VTSSWDQKKTRTGDIIMGPRKTMMKYDAGILLTFLLQLVRWFWRQSLHFENKRHHLVAKMKWFKFSFLKQEKVLRFTPVLFNLFQLAEPWKHYLDFGGTLTLIIVLIWGFSRNPLKNERNLWVPRNPGWKTLVYTQKMYSFWLEFNSSIVTMIYEMSFNRLQPEPNRIQLLWA